MENVENLFIHAQNSDVRLCVVMLFVAFKYTHIQLGAVWNIKIIEALKDIIVVYKDVMKLEFHSDDGRW